MEPTIIPAAGKKWSMNWELDSLERGSIWQ